jgi:hypothetical protein
MPFQPGHNLATGRPLGSQNKATIAKQKRQELFDLWVSQEFEALVAVAKPEYKLDRFMGKMPDKMEMTAVVSDDDTLTPDIIAKAKELLKQEMIKPNADETGGQGDTVLPKGE